MPRPSPYWQHNLYLWYSLEPVESHTMEMIQIFPSVRGQGSACCDQTHKARVRFHAGSPYDGVVLVSFPPQLNKANTVTRTHLTDEKLKSDTLNTAKRLPNPRSFTHHSAFPCTPWIQRADPSPHPRKLVGTTNSVRLPRSPNLN